MKSVGVNVRGALLVSLVVGACTGLDDGSGDGPIPARNEVVMAPRTTLSATTTTGTLEIASGAGLNRCFTWEGGTRCVEMWPRQERWYGSLGLYFPGPGRHWSKHNGISRAVVEEGRQDFKTLDEAMGWIAKTKRAVPLVYRNDGLLVGWGKELEREQMNVDIWQILIAGEKPSSLVGASDDAIAIRPSAAPSSQVPGPLDAPALHGDR